MIERKIIEEVVFHPIFGEQRQVHQVPASASLLYREWLQGWYKDFPNTPGIIPSVSLHPAIREGRKVYIVAKEVFCLTNDSTSLG